MNKKNELFSQWLIVEQVFTTIGIISSGIGAYLLRDTVFRETPIKGLGDTPWQLLICIFILILLIWRYIAINNLSNYLKSPSGLRS